MALDVREEQFCMVISKYRVIQGLALYYSLKKTKSKFRIFILCIDDETLEIMKAMIREDVLLISVELLEDDHLSLLRQSRLLEEYCWTLKPVFLEYVLNNYIDITRITYLDADLFFYSEPNKIFKGIDEYSALLSCHDFSRQYTPLNESCGLYNSGLISFSNNTEGRSCIKWWKDSCYNLCCKQFKNNQFGDQKYLEEMASKFSNIKFIKEIGVNTAPWNHSKYVISSIRDCVVINNEKLCCYHFSGFRLVNKLEFSLNFINERKPNPILFKPYLQMINQVISDCQKIRPDIEDCFIAKSEKKSISLYKITMFNNSK